MTKNFRDESHKPLIENNEASNASNLGLDWLNLEFVYQNSELVNKKSYNFIPGVYITEIEREFFTPEFLDNKKPEILIPLELSNPLKASEIVTGSHKTKTLTANSLQTDSNLFRQLEKKGLIVGLGLGVLLSWALTNWFSPKISPANQTTSTPVSESVTSARAVTVGEVEQTIVERTLNTSGTVAAYEEIPVMSQATGLQITKILADRGAYVRRGQVLAELSDKRLQAEMVQAQGAVAQAQARLNELQAGSRPEEIAQAQARVDNTESDVVQAESDLDLVQKRVKRNQALQIEGAITRDLLDEILNQERVASSNLIGAKARLQEATQELAQLKAGTRLQTIRQAEAELTQAKGRLQLIAAQLEDTKIIAPVDGIIATRKAQVGEIVSNSESLFSIIENGRLELRLKVPETLIRKITRDKKVRITSDVDRNLELLGKVREIDPVIDDSSRLAMVKVDLPSGINLKPGMFLKADITTATTPGKTVPIEALLPQSDSQAIAFVLQEDNTVRSQLVDMGEILTDRRIEILQGLAAGDRVVLKGSAYLKDGDQVTISTTSSEI